MGSGYRRTGGEETVTLMSAELIGPALDLMVCRAISAGGNDGWGWFEIDDEGFLFDPLNECRYSPSTQPENGYAIADKAKITIIYDKGSSTREPSWFATREPMSFSDQHGGQGTGSVCVVAQEYGVRGPSPLIAAMRCVVISELGPTVQVPQALIDTPAASAPAAIFKP